MPASDSKPGRGSLVGLFKEVFNWYPSGYPSEERRSVVFRVCLFVPSQTNRRRLLFKLDVSILVFACLCCKLQVPYHTSEGLTETVFVKYLGKEQAHTSRLNQNLMWYRPNEHQQCLCQRPQRRFQAQWERAQLFQCLLLRCIRGIPGPWPPSDVASNVVSWLFSNCLTMGSMLKKLGLVGYFLDLKSSGEFVHSPRVG